MPTNPKICLLVNSQISTGQFEYKHIEMEAQVPPSNVEEYLNTMNKYLELQEIYYRRNPIIEETKEEKEERLKQRKEYLAKIIAEAEQGIETEDEE